MNVDALRLIGSSARGQMDSTSDTDVLLIVSGQDANFARRWTACFDDLSVYTSARYREMHAQGHLFTWHVYLESVPVERPKDMFPISYPDLISELGAPARYLAGHVDASVLVSVLAGAIDSVEAGNPSLLFDAGVIFVAIRNLGIIASWHFGNVSFSSDAPFQLGSSVLDFPLSLDEYQVLRKCRKCAGRGIPCPSVERSWILKFAPPLKNWADTLLTLLR